MRKLQEKWWRKVLDRGEKLLWYGARAGLFGLSLVPFRAAVFAMILVIGYKLVTGDGMRLYELIIPGMLILGAWLVLNILLIVFTPFFAVTDKGLLRARMFRITRINYGDIDYIGPAELIRQMKEDHRKMGDGLLPDDKEGAPEYDLFTYPADFTVLAGETQITFSVSDYEKPASIIKEMIYELKATPQRAGGADAQSDFSSDCMKMTPLG